MGIESYEQLALRRSDSALAQGALIPLDTRQIPLLGSEQFELRELTSDLPKHLRKTGPKPNPFRPWDQRLEVSAIGSHHALILNKYPVQLGHMLLITKDWASQGDWLDSRDWTAVSAVDANTTGLWFFNSGPLAGASQPHRHLQLLPRQSGAARCPREPWFLNLLNGHRSEEGRPDAAIAASTAIRTRQVGHRCPGKHLAELYAELSDELHLGQPDQHQTPKSPYNLLITDQWMAMVKRRTDGIHGFSVNALGFAGYLLATDQADRHWLSIHGPDQLLAEVVEPIRETTDDLNTKT
jgi:ATP adenylyltransferase